MDKEPASDRQAANDASECGNGVPPPSETRADRIWRRIADNPAGALLVVALALLTAIGRGIGGARAILDLFSGSPQRPVPVVHLNLSERATAKNDRYGFSFRYPATWQREDPGSGDGLAAIGPDPGLVAFGALPVLGPAPDDAFARLDYRTHEISTGKRVIEGPTQQNLTRALPGVKGELGRL